MCTCLCMRALLCACACVCMCVRIAHARLLCAHPCTALQAQQHTFCTVACLRHFVCAPQAPAALQRSMMPLPSMCEQANPITRSHTHHSTCKRACSCPLPASAPAARCSQRARAAAAPQAAVRAAAAGASRSAARPACTLAGAFAAACSAPGNYLLAHMRA